MKRRSVLQSGALVLLLGAQHIARGATILAVRYADALSESISPVQTAFLTQDAYQCGYCTPGMVMKCWAKAATCSIRMLIEKRADTARCSAVCKSSKSNSTGNAALRVIRISAC